MTVTIPRSQVFLPSVYFILLATVFSAFTFEGKNFLFIGVSIAAALLLVVVSVRSMPMIKNGQAILILLYILVTATLNYALSQWTSVVYSVFFVVSYLLYFSFITAHLDVLDYGKLLKAIFWLYFAGLLLGQLNMVIFGFTPVYVTGTVVHGLFGVMIDGGQYRFYSLSSEPSYAAFIVVTVFYSYMKVNTGDKSLVRGENLAMLLGLLYMLFFFRSAYGALLFGLFLVSLFGFSRNALIIYFLTACLGVSIFMFQTNLPFVFRIVNIIENFDPANPHQLSAIDFNSYYRVAPLLHYAGMADLQDIHFWIGHGASASRQMVIPETFLASQGESLNGFIPAFFYDYGVLGALLVGIFVFKFVPGVFSIPSFILFLMMFNANFNTQLFWFVVTCLSLNHYYLQKEKREIVQSA